MTTLQKIKELLELGYEVEVEEIENGVSYIRNVFDYRFGKFSYNFLDNVSYLLEKELENIEILRIIPKKPKLLEVGRKVKVVKCNSEYNGKEYLIDRIEKENYCLKVNVSDFCWALLEIEPHEVIPVYDEEETVIVSFYPLGHKGNPEVNKYNKSEFEQAIKDLKEIK